MSQKARDALLWKISRRDLSEREAQAWLLSKGYTAEEADDAVGACRDWRAIDEDRLLGAVIRSELRKGRGYAAIRLKVKVRKLVVAEGVLRARYEKELSELDSGVLGGGALVPTGFEDEREEPADIEGLERERAMALVARRYPEYRTDPATRQKAFQFLVRRGFPLSRVSDWLRS